MADSHDPQSTDQLFDFSELESIRQSTEGVSLAAQSIRKKSLTETRNLLYFIGVLTAATSLYSLAMSANEVSSLNLPSARAESILLITRLIYGVSTVTGAFYILAGYFLLRYPVALTVLSLIVHVGYMGFPALYNPMYLSNGLLLKVVVLISLISAVRLARDYERSMKKTSSN